jgi:hypothetical protein
LGIGNEFCVRILNPQWHCFTWEDWQQFVKDGKKARKQQRREVQRAISPEESYRLVLA